MKKNTSIGFKDSIEEEKDHNEDTEQIPSPSEIAEATEEKIRSQQEFDQHMEEFNMLQKANAKYKMIIKGIMFLFILAIFGYICYCFGAYRQINGNGPYTKITTTDNYQLIIRK